MALNLPTFYKRTASAIVFAAIMLVGLFWNIWTFYILICVINVLCMGDYFRLLQKIEPEQYWPAWLKFGIQIAGLLLITIAACEEYIPLALVPLLLVIPSSILLGSALSRTHSLLSGLLALGGLFYITIPFFLLARMELHDFVFPAAVIFMIWTNDTMAYLVGSFIGKNSFSPISPKKTWEGVIGGIILTIAGAVIYASFAHSYSLLSWGGLALVVSVTGTLGDLLESKLKRLADVKDSGTLMPGHGGALDRFDSLLVAAPFAFVYVYYFMH